MANDLKGQVMHLMAGNISCQELADLITEYLEGSLTFSERIRLQIHLGLGIGISKGHLGWTGKYQRPR